LHDDRLPTEVWVMAHIRQCLAEGTTATVVHKGDAKGGTLMLKLNLLDRRFRVLSQARGLDGALGWLAAFKGEMVPETEADEHIARAISRDPDLWVVEIEHRDGRHPFEGKEI
jgi:hypothetical protein